MPNKSEAIRTFVEYILFLFRFCLVHMKIRSDWLKQVDTTKYLVMRGYVVSAIVTKLKMKLIFY